MALHFSDLLIDKFVDRAFGFDFSSVARVKHLVQLFRCSGKACQQNQHHNQRKYESGGLRLFDIENWLIGRSCLHFDFPPGYLILFILHSANATVDGNVIQVK